VLLGTVLAQETDLIGGSKDFSVHDLICSKALMIISIYKYIAIFMKFRKIIDISRVL
jgi:hypothetical protein